MEKAVYGFGIGAVEGVEGCDFMWVHIVLGFFFVGV